MNVQFQRLLYTDSYRWSPINLLKLSEIYRRMNGTKIEDRAFKRQGCWHVFERQPNGVLQFFKITVPSAVGSVFHVTSWVLLLWAEICVLSDIWNVSRPLWMCVSWDWHSAFWRTCNYVLESNSASVIVELLKKRPTNTPVVYIFAHSYDIKEYNATVQGTTLQCVMQFQDHGVVC